VNAGKGGRINRDAEGREAGKTKNGRVRRAESLTQTAFRRKIGGTLLEPQAVTSKGIRHT